MIPGVRGASQHATMVGLAVAHWALAGCIPFGVAATAALPARQGRADLLNGDTAATRTLVAAVVGSVGAEVIFWALTIYGGSQITGRPRAALRHGHPSAYSWGQVIAVLVLGTATGLLMARAQRRGMLRARQRP